MNDRLKLFLIGLPLLAATIIAIFVAISFVTDDPHWLNRGGALVAACSAGAIFFQIRSEIGIERERHELESISHITAKVSPISPVDRVRDRLVAKKIERQGAGLTEERLKIAASVVLCALVGELLHGFGDLALELLCVTCFTQ
ncbi:MAG: hypothetical protein ACXW02_05970 [Halobacteriota archaeon]